MIGPLVLVEWHDAATLSAGGWVALEDIPQGHRLNRTVGWLLNGANPGELVLAQAWDETAGLVGNVDTIPLVMVQRIIALVHGPSLPEQTGTEFIAAPI